MVIEAGPVVAAWLAADFLSGVFHWWEDRYGNESWPIIGPLVVSPNVLHHSQPTAFLAGNVITRNWTTVIPSLALAAAAHFVGLRWLSLVFAFTATANEVHAWAHQKCSRPIRAMQLLGILQSQEQHAVHHRKPFDQNYCVMTDFLNPVLSACGFWSAIEWTIGLAGVRPAAARIHA